MIDIHTVVPCPALYRQQGERQRRRAEEASAEKPAYRFRTEE